MIDWMSPDVVAADGFIFLKINHVVLGWYLWDWITTLEFDWQYISGKKAFRWPLAFYFLNRYSLLFSHIGACIALNVKTEINCQTLYILTQLTGCMAIGLASINLSIRTMAVWNQRWFIVVPVVLVILGHWTILLHGVIIKAKWDPAVGCVITDTNPTILTATFIYTMCLDFIVLCLMAFRLHTWVAGRSPIGTMIFADGLVYFIVAFLVNVINVTFVLLNLNPIMSIIAAAPATTAATIVTCTAVRRLANYTSKGAQLYQALSINTSNPVGKDKATTRQSISVGSDHGGVRIEMRTIEHQEPSDDKGNITQSDIKSYLVL